MGMGGVGPGRRKSQKERMMVGSGAGRGEVRADVVDLLSVPYVEGPSGHVQPGFTREGPGA